MNSDAAQRSASSAAGAPRRVERVASGWIKRAEPAGKNHWAGVLRAATRLSPWALLRSTATTGDRVSLGEETARLRRWHAAGLPVPAVVDSGDGFLVTADAGLPLRRWLRDEADAGARLAAVRLAATALGRLHRAGHCHGRPFLKDIVYDGERVTFIDLEEEPTRVMPLRTAQVRDLMLFVMSCTALLGERHGFGDLRAVAAAYHEANPAPELVRSLRRNVGAFWWLALPLRLWPWRRLGRDGRQAVLGLRVLRRLAG